MRLDRVDIHGEHEARERTWEVVRAAFAEREPIPRRMRRLAPALAFAVLAAALAAAFTPPGRAVVDKVREAIGVETAEQALFSLPAEGRLLVVSDAGAWAVSQDGSKRRLGDYDEAGCSPFGRFLLGSRPNELAALETDGDVRWKLARPQVHSSDWGGITRDTRIAYISRGIVHVVAGDGTGDRAVVAGHAVAWRPRSEHVLAVATADGVSLIGGAGWTAKVRATTLEWSGDGKRLLASTPRGYVVLSASGKVLKRGEAAEAAFGPRGSRLASVRPGSELRLDGKLRFQGTGTFRDLTWSPDGRWLAFVWPDADQVVFVRASGPRRIEAASNLTAQFEGTTAPRVAAWCPAPR